MTRYFPLLAAFIFASTAFAQDTPTDSIAVEMAPVDSTEEVIRFDPDRAKALSAEGDVLFGEKDYEGAIERYTLGIAYDSTYAKNPFGMARAQASLRQYTEAVDSYKMAIKLGTGAEGMGNVVTAARTEMETIQKNLSAQQSAQQIADKITRATTMLQAEPLTANAAETAYELLEEARMADYDSSQVAFYYAKALNTMGRYGEAVPYAQMAVDMNAGADQSAYYIQLGLAHMGLDNDEQAREAFTATQGGAWEAWGTHYLGQLDAKATEGGEAGG